MFIFCKGSSHSTRIYSVLEWAFYISNKDQVSVKSKASVCVNFQKVVMLTFPSLPLIKRYNSTTLVPPLWGRGEGRGGRVNNHGAGGDNRKRASSSKRRVGTKARPTAGVPAPGPHVSAGFPLCMLYPPHVHF